MTKVPLPVPLQLLLCLLIPAYVWAETLPAGEADAQPPVASAVSVSAPTTTVPETIAVSAVPETTPASVQPEAIATSGVPETISASAVPESIPAASAVQAFTEMSAASAPQAVEPAASAVIAPPPPEGCLPTTFKAMAADKKAFNSQREKLDMSEQARLFDKALALWTLAVEQCEGRGKEQAQHNLTNNQRARAAISEKLSSGEQCMEIHKYAESYQGMAKQALSERRWNDATILFNKSTDMWEMATEYCSGIMQTTAGRRHDETAQDAHNAEFCAPLFERAREHTQKLRASAALLSPEEKRNFSMEAETLWRDAGSQCMGAAVQNVALNNARALGRERATPWVERRPDGMAAPVPPPPVAETRPIDQRDIPKAQVPETTATTPAVASTVAPNVTPAEKPTPQETSVVVLPIPSALPVAATVAVVAQTATVAAEAAQPSAAPTPPPAKFSAEHAVGLSEFSGHGTITWAVGDVYEGDLLKGMRHGKGRFNWANGQSYEGDWQNDKAVGQGIIRFANGDIYEGKVRDSLPQGRGHMQYSNGNSYNGSFEAGVAEGVGIYAWGNGLKYEGALQSGRPNGQGRMDFPSGESYLGNFVNGEPDGEGVYHFLNGDQYSGEWKAGKKHGQGSYIWKNGNHWEGRFENNQRVVDDNQVPSN